MPIIRMEEMTQLTERVAQSASSNTNTCVGDEETVRPARLGDAMENVVRIKAYGYFLETGSVG